MDGILYCVFCGAGVPEEEAPEAAWTPYFYRENEEEAGPVCPDCAGKHLDFSQPEPQIKPRGANFSPNGGPPGSR